MKVSILINSMMGGGAEKVVATLYPEFQKEISDISLICLEENDYYKIEGVTPVYLSHQTGTGEGGLKKFLSLFSFALRLKKYVKKNQINLVQSHIYRSNYINVLARLLGAKHKVQIVNHGIPSQYLNEGLLGKVNLFLVRWLYPKADQVICPSQGMVGQLIALGIPKEKLQLIHNPFDLEELRAMATHDMVEDEFEFDPQKEYLICIGRLQTVKRMEDAVWAFYELQKERVQLGKGSVELIILGDGEKFDSIKLLGIQLAIGKKVHLLGHVKNPYKYLTHSNALVSASEFEGFSNVIVEALAVGTPVISTDCESGPREILSPNLARKKQIAPGCVEKVTNGLLVPVGDIHALVKAMRQLLSDQDLQYQFCSSGRERAERFSSSLIAEGYMGHIKLALALELTK